MSDGKKRGGEWIQNDRVGSDARTGERTKSYRVLKIIGKTNEPKPCALRLMRRPKLIGWPLRIFHRPCFRTRIEPEPDYWPVHVINNFGMFGALEIKISDWILPGDKSAGGKKFSDPTGWIARVWNTTASRILFISPCTLLHNEWTLLNGGGELGAFAAHVPCPEKLWRAPKLL